MPRRKNQVTQLSTQIREDKIKITLIPTRDNSLKMTLLQHVINKNTLSHVSLPSQRELDRRWLHPRLLAYVITGWLHRGNTVSACLVLVHPEHTPADLLLSLIYRWGWSRQGKGCFTGEISDPPAPKACTNGLSETCRGPGSTAKVINRGGEEPKGQAVHPHHCGKTKQASAGL